MIFFTYKICSWSFTAEVEVLYMIRALWHFILLSIVVISILSTYKLCSFVANWFSMRDNIVFNIYKMWLREFPYNLSNVSKYGNLLYNYSSI